MVTVNAEETLAGASYVAAAVEVLANVPQVPPLQLLPDTVQFTPWLLESLATVAVKLIACPASTVCWELGERVTETDGLAGLIVAGEVDPPPQLAKRNTPATTIPMAHFTVTCYPLQNRQAVRSIVELGSLEYLYQ
jgi:hypothetical protein